jgi:catechol 2,3-dioxygenase-like lactoylglutathione lyase family enzyme
VGDGVHALAVIVLGLAAAAQSCALDSVRAPSTEAGPPMLDRFYLNPVLPAQDGDRARAFYRDVLGLKLMSGPHDDPMMFQAGAGTGLVITEIPERVPADYAVVSFLVEGIEGLVQELTAQGVGFERPDSSTFQGQPATITGHIIDYGPVKSAWFRDTEGNILALNELVT